MLLHVQLTSLFLLLLVARAEGINSIGSQLHDPEESFPFRNTSLPWDERVDDLVSRLTLDEVVLQLARGGTGPGNGPAPAIPRLGINPYSWATECLRGLADAGPATSFPHSLGLAASFNRSLLHSVAEATAKEARAKYANYTAHGLYGDHMGISCFSPVVNIMRHPLWGRNQETYGEDPFLSGQLGKAFVQGLQGDHPRYIRANAGCKHFDVHGGPENIPENRLSFDAKVTERDWRLTFLPAFHGCVVEGQSLSVMCSYNRLNGIPACANSKLLRDILRDEWNFTGYVVSDQDALENIVTWHKWKDTMEEAAAAALLAGTNLGLSTNNEHSVFTYLPIALEKNLVARSQIYEAAKPLFYVRMRLGEFDPPELNPFTKYSLDLIQSKQHRDLSIYAAMQSFVLLKNNGVLPLKSNHFHDISVVGPMANNIPQYFGDYSPNIDLNFTTTPLVSLQSMADSVHYAEGCSEVKCFDYSKDDVKRVVQIPNTQLIVVCLGTGVASESEANDRADMTFSGQQEELLKDVLQFRDEGIPVIVLLFTAGPIQLDSQIVSQSDAIIDCFYPAQATGEALRKILLNEGPGSNPGGRLPFTWPTDMSQVPNMTDYSMNNRTYRYWDQDSPRFPFGYGLSYTTFKYSNLKVKNTNPLIGEDVSFEVTIENTGEVDGDEVVQAYISWVDSPEPMPYLQLVAFERIHIQAGEKATWNTYITAKQLAIYFDTGFKQIKGEIQLYVGGQQPNQTVQIDSNILQVNLFIDSVREKF